MIQQPQEKEDLIPSGEDDNAVPVISIRPEEMEDFAPLLGYSSLRSGVHSSKRCPEKDVTPPMAKRVCLRDYKDLSTCSERDDLSHSEEILHAREQDDAIRETDDPLESVLRREASISHQLLQLKTTLSELYTKQRTLQQQKMAILRDHGKQMNQEVKDEKITKKDMKEKKNSILKGDIGELKGKTKKKKKKAKDEYAKAEELLTSEDQLCGQAEQPIALDQPLLTSEDQLCGEAEQTIALDQPLLTSEDQLFCEAEQPIALDQPLLTSEDQLCCEAEQPIALDQPLLTSKDQLCCEAEQPIALDQPPHTLQFSAKSKCEDEVVTCMVICQSTLVLGCESGRLMITPLVEDGLLKPKRKVRKVVISHRLQTISCAHSAPVICIRALSQFSRVVSISRNEQALIHDVPQGHLYWCYTFFSPASAICCHKLGIFIGAENGSVFRFLEDRLLNPFMEFANTPVLSMGFVKNGGWNLCALNADSNHISMKSMKHKERNTRFEAPCELASFLIQGKFCISAAVSSVSKMFVHDKATGVLLSSVDLSAPVITMASLSSGCLGSTAVILADKSAFTFNCKTLSQTSMPPAFSKSSVICGLHNGFIVYLRSISILYFECCKCAKQVQRKQGKKKEKGKDKKTKAKKNKVLNVSTEVEFIQSQGEEANIECQIGNCGMRLNPEWSRINNHMQRHHPIKFDCDRRSMVCPWRGCTCIITAPEVCVRNHLKKHFFKNVAMSSKKQLPPISI